MKAVMERETSLHSRPLLHVGSSDDLSVLVEELGEHTKLESIGIVEEYDDEEDEGTVGLQETYNSLIEKTGEYA